MTQFRVSRPIYTVTRGTYVARDGDTLGSIAESFTGEACNCDELVGANLHLPFDTCALERLGTTDVAQVAIPMGSELLIPYRWYQNAATIPYRYARYGMMLQEAANAEPDMSEVPDVFPGPPNMDGVVGMPPQAASFRALPGLADRITLADVLFPASLGEPTANVPPWYAPLADAVGASVSAMVQAGEAGADPAALTNAVSQWWIMANGAGATPTPQQSAALATAAVSWWREAGSQMPLELARNFPWNRIPWGAIDLADLPDLGADEWHAVCASITGQGVYNQTRLPAPVTDASASWTSGDMPDAAQWSVGVPWNDVCWDRIPWAKVDWNKARDVASTIAAINAATSSSTPPADTTTTDTPWYKKPGVLLAGVAAVGVGGYLLLSSSQTKD